MLRLIPEYCNSLQLSSQVLLIFGANIGDIEHKFNLINHFAFNELIKEKLAMNLSRFSEIAYHQFVTEKLQFAMSGDCLRTDQGNFDHRVFSALWLDALSLIIR